MNITDDNFDEEIKSQDKFVLVDFFATWCGPCAMLGPMLEKIAEHFKEKIILIKIDVDNFPKTSQKFSVEKIPTVILFENGKPINGFVGLLPEKTIKEWLENTLKETKK